MRVYLQWCRSEAREHVYVTSDSPHSLRNSVVKTTEQMEMRLSFWSVSVLRRALIIRDKALVLTCAGVHVCYRSKPSTRPSQPSVLLPRGLLPLPLCSSQQCCCPPAGLTPNLRSTSTLQTRCTWTNNNGAAICASTGSA